MTAPLNARQLAAIGTRIRSRGDMHIEIAHQTLARLCLTAEVPYGFGRRMLEVPPNETKRQVDAAALNALLLIAESKLPQEPPNAPVHGFRPSSKHPWICADCGYGPGEALKHEQGVA